jgi:DNA mismatch repair protein MutS
VAVKETGEKIVFLRKIQPGPCDKSYGIHVAQMAGLPASVISRASDILEQLVRHEPLTEQPTPKRSTDQIDLFAERESHLREAIAAMEPDQMTPMEALTKLAQLKRDHEL